MAAEPHESPWMASARRLPRSEETRGIGPLGLPCGISRAARLERGHPCPHHSGGRKSTVTAPSGLSSPETCPWFAGGRPLAVSSRGLSSVQVCPRVFLSCQGH